MISPRGLGVASRVLLFMCALALMQCSHGNRSSSRRRGLRDSSDDAIIAGNTGHPSHTKAAAGAAADVVDYESLGWADGLGQEELMAVHATADGAGVVGQHDTAALHRVLLSAETSSCTESAIANSRDGCSAIHRSLAARADAPKHAGDNTKQKQQTPPAAAGAVANNKEGGGIVINTDKNGAHIPHHNNNAANAVATTSANITAARKAPPVSNLTAAIAYAKADIQKHISDKHLTGHLHKTAAPYDSKSLFDGYMLNIENFPRTQVPRTNIEWSEFSNVALLKSSAAYDIFVGTWEKQKVIIKRVMNVSSNSKTQPRKGSHTEMEMEIEILSRLNHPNIIKILGSGTKPLRFSVLEFLSGGTLSAKLNYTYRDHEYYGITLPKAKAFEYAIKIASALAYMHEDWHKAARLFHRDLKTDNIAFTASGEIKLFDFGLAKGLRKTIQDDEDAAFPFGKGAGSWRYMAPEVALGEPYNHKSDVYSYSMILYHLLRGKHPVPNDMNRTEHYDEFHLNYWRPNLSLNLFRNWPLQLTQLMARSWNYDIRVRPNFKEMVAELKEIEKKFVDVGTTKVQTSGPRFVEYKEKQR